MLREVIFLSINCDNHNMCFEYPQHMFGREKRKIIPKYTLVNVWRPSELTLRLLVSSADNLSKKFGPRSGPTKRRA